MVRDDFWLGVSRFLDELDVDLVEGQNTAFLDLFDKRHARFVLKEFGRAYGCLDSDPNAMTSEQEEFVDRIISQLSRNSRVVPVRLSLCADMLKGRPWTLESLQQFENADSLGVMFLQETFSSSTDARRGHHQQHVVSPGRGPAGQR